MTGSEAQGRLWSDRTNYTVEDNNSPASYFIKGYLDRPITLRWDMKVVCFASTCALLGIKSK